jgi:hypothetical protein
MTQARKALGGARQLVPTVERPARVGAPLSPWGPKRAGAKGLHEIEAGAISPEGAGNWTDL